jgi:hypothetical protein
MVDQIARQQALLDEANRVALAAWAIETTPRRPGPVVIDDHYLLEDHDGLPIACPLCGQVDRWHARHEATSDEPSAFTCAHTVRIGAAGLTRRVATVGIEQVGDYLPLADLLLADVA